MINASGTPEKVARRDKLFDIGVSVLEKQGYTVGRVPGLGKSSVRRITKGGKSQIVSIRTTQDTSIAFPRNSTDTGWVTLSEVDAVVAVSVDDRLDPKFAQVHIIDGNEIRKRFDRTYAARMDAGHSIPLGRGVWLSLYVPDSDDSPTHVGAGAGLDFPYIAKVPLSGAMAETVAPAPQTFIDDAPLTIAEAKRRLALSLGVDPSSIKITVEA